MPLDLNSIPAITRKAQIKLGRQYGSQDTLAQANQTLTALGLYAEDLVAEGFIPADVMRLTEARDMLMAAGVGRESARSNKKTTNRAYTDAMSQGKAKRLRARTVLENTMAVLIESPEPGASDAVREIQSTLRQTHHAGDDAETLAAQLDQLAATLGLPDVRLEAQHRGGAQAIAELTASAAALREADQKDATVAGTPAETQLLDHLDGIIIGLVRRARKAARSAAKQLGDPSIAQAFELNKLYRTSSKRRISSGGDLPSAIA